MNKTISISIDHKKFDLEEEGFQLLNDYLLTIKKHFSSHEDQAEIIADVENSIAAKFLEKLNKHKQVITKEDVKVVIKDLGKIEDFEVFEAQNSKKKREQNANVSTPKRLYRDPDNKILGGVSSGLGAYFGIDPTWIRIAFILTTIFWGFGLMIYLILWIIVPEAKTAAQKIALHGGQVTLSSLQAKTTAEPVQEDVETRKNIRKFLGICLIILSSLILLLSLGILVLIPVGGIAIFFLPFFLIFLLPSTFLLALGIKLVQNNQIPKTMLIFLMISIIVSFISLGLYFFPASHVSISGL